MELKLKTKLNKLSAELRFKPKLASWENTLFIAQMFEKEFPDWQIDQGVRSHIVLFSREDKEFLKVGYNSLAYVGEGKDDISRFLKFIRTVSSKFEENKIEVFQQLGCRNISFFEAEVNYPELSEIIFEKFYGSQKRLREISAQQIKDVAYILDGEKNDFKNNCRIGPMLKTQMLETFRSAFKIEDSSIDENKTYLYVDIDTYTTNLSFTNLRESVDIFEKAYEESHRILKEYLEFIKKIENEDCN